MTRKNPIEWYREENPCSDIKPERTHILVKMCLTEENDDGDMIMIGMEEKEFTIDENDPSIQKILEELKDRGVQNILNEDVIKKTLKNRK